MSLGTSLPIDRKFNDLSKQIGFFRSAINLADELPEKFWDSLNENLKKNLCEEAKNNEAALLKIKEKLKL